ncbi:23S rRNA m(6)A-1618 methyltransferase [Neolewinella xylanilytica]|uniref:23S rRNA m(6)A-1618 methyltransferase n=1 Tax=Neolewinella xylanilytica TaxID=1514080 RepID=A0A2S6I0H1_9BACT|nr:23S rRNA (adenine(1618)-N(6))-methyltransferase RlmF [Neolewinella xylanilytica]PPK84267.1 23S rRNA m(6)A-1618 methyltransferase [Neolewinella xylanilytica]
MHPRNRYQDKHDFPALIAREPRLGEYLVTTPAGRSLDFSKREALVLLNRALLRRDYGLTHWDLPEGHLVPPIPGRLDYIHALADLTGEPGRVLDIGTGASLIYPILGVVEYRWDFVASDISARAVKVATAIATMNPVLKRRVDVRLQPEPSRFFTNVIRPGERFGATLCNPPFYESREAAVAAGKKKWRKLGREDNGLSFGGSDTELWTAGGEQQFLRNMIRESHAFGDRVGWFTTLVSKKGYLQAAKADLERLRAAEVRVLPMEQGNKRSRMLAWRFR